MDPDVDDPTATTGLDAEYYERLIALGNMDVIALYAHARSLQGTIARLNAVRARLYAERRDIWLRLRDADQQQSTIAKAAGVSPMAVKFATKEPE